MVKDSLTRIIEVEMKVISMFEIYLEMKFMRINDELSELEVCFKDDSQDGDFLK